MEIIIIVIIIYIVIYIVKIIKKGLKVPILEKEIKNLKIEKDNLFNKYNKELSNLAAYYDSTVEKLKKEKKAEEIKAKERFLERELEIKKDLANYKLNNTMIQLYEDFYKKSIEEYENYFKNKKRPSIKSAEILSEIKDDYKNLKIENKKLKLILSEFIDDDIKKESTKFQFDSKEKAYKYGRLSKDEWNKLTYIEKLDIVLKKYINSWKDKLNIGLEFERYCGYLYENKGYQVKYWGILNGKSDGGIDLIAKNKDTVLYIQCKYWSNHKTIRENTITQLFGSALKIAIDNGDTYDSFIKKIKNKKIKIILLSKSEISKEAKIFCEKLNVLYKENIEIDSTYPRVKLVHGEEKIFYIPTDLQYDNISFGSTYKKYDRAFTCKEAENKGYRHCYKWKS